MEPGDRRCQGCVFKTTHTHAHNTQQESPQISIGRPIDNLTDDN